MLYTETNFLHRNQKLVPKWLGPTEIIKLSYTNATVKLKNGKSKQFHLLCIKPFKFKKMHPKINYDSDEEDFSENKSDATPNETFNEPQQRTHVSAHMLAPRKALDQFH